MCGAADKAVNKENLSALKSRLKDYYDEGNAETRRDRMSQIESAFFWPAVQKAYVRSPNLNSKRTWREGLGEVEGEPHYWRIQLGCPK
jgi:hypothetical protein